MGDAMFLGTSERLDRVPYGSETKTLPVRVEDVRLHIALDNQLDDPLVVNIVHQALDDAESRGGVSLLNQRRRLVLSKSDLVSLDGKSSTLVLPYGPVNSITGIYYLDSEEQQQSLEGSRYRFISRGMYRGVYFKEIPSTADGDGVLWIEYESGYGDSASDIPAAWQAVLLTIASRRYEYRHVMGGGLDESFDKMLMHMIIAAGGVYRYV